MTDSEINGMTVVGRFPYVGDDNRPYLVVELKPVVTVQADGRTYTGYDKSVFRLQNGTALIKQDVDRIYKISDTGVTIRPAEVPL